MPATALLLAETIETDDFTRLSSGLVSGFGLDQARPRGNGGLGGSASAAGAANGWRALSFWSALPGSASASGSTVSNCSPNCTDGSKNPLIAANGTTSFSGTPLNDSPTSNPSSVTFRSQN